MRMSVVLFRLIIYYFFFFQAEDGIRDYKVTGVQTCALPIYLFSLVGNDYIPPPTLLYETLGLDTVEKVAGYVGKRSEERRVGKECRCRWGRYHEKEKEGRNREAVARAGRLDVQQKRVAVVQT